MCHRGLAYVPNRGALVVRCVHVLVLAARAGAWRWSATERGPRLGLSAMPVCCLPPPRERQLARLKLQAVHAAQRPEGRPAAARQFKRTSAVRCRERRVASSKSHRGAAQHADKDRGARAHAGIKDDGWHGALPGQPDRSRLEIRDSLEGTLYYTIDTTNSTTTHELSRSLANFVTEW